MRNDAAASGSVEVELKEKIRMLESRNKELEAAVRGEPINCAEVSILRLALERTGSLAVFLGCLSVTAIILESWEQTLLRDVEMTFFVPLMIGHGGNMGGSVVGSTLASMIQRPPPLTSTLKRELIAGGIVGIILTAAASALPFIMHIEPHTVLLIMASLLSITLMSALLGATLPFIFKRLKLDPNTLAPPAVTTLIDALGLIIYLSIADRIVPTFPTSNS